jgi:TolB-like protein/Tfp pilus assembly protein PilF
MEYIDGEGLAERIETGSLDIDEALNIAIQIAEGLRRAHRRGIVHRDIKSANILIDEDGQAKILDFGLAKLTGKTRLTKTATVMGTVTYMSPEQAHGKAAIDHHTDIWSLGILLYEMLAGKQPFDAPSDAGLIYKIIHEEPEPLSSVRPDVPSALEQAIRKTIQKNPEDRYEDMEALISDLKAIRSGSAPQIIVEEKTTPSIAVLPFADMSPQKDQEYFCDGISESLINELTQITDLRVIARTSAFSFKGQNLDVREIGKKLNVDTILEGSIQKAGNRLRVTAQLINTARGEHLWSEKFDRDMEDIFAIQDEISQVIVDKLKPQLLPEDKAKLSQRQTVDPEAYNLYLKGRWFWNKQTHEDLLKAIECFEQAIRKAPDYALAYAGLADCYTLLPFHGPSEPRKTIPKAREATLKALELDENVAEAHCSLAFIKTVHDWEWKEAEKGFKRAIELNPRYATAHHLFAIHLLYAARFDEAVEEISLALELEPLTLQINADAGLILSYADQFERAIETLKKTIEMDPNSVYSHFILGLIYWGQQMFGEAMAELQKAKALSEELHHPTEIGIGIFYALTGKKDQAEKVLANLLELSQQEYISPYLVALLLFTLERCDDGFLWLEKAYEAHDYSLGSLKMEPTFSLLGIDSDPRYRAMLKKIGLDKSDATVPMIEQSPSIVVLPFANMSADPDQEYFCDGLAEELINALTQLKDLHVVARTSAFSFKGKETDVRQIGNTLNVKSVLEGSVRKAGNRLRITAQLVNVDDGYHLWSERYDREMEDIFAIQDEITLAIVDRLKPKLLRTEKAKLAKRRDVDPEAHNLYLRGRFFWNKATEEGLKKALALFEQATKKDPAFAAAYAGIADCYNILIYHTLLFSPKEIYPKAITAVRRALEIDDTLAEAHASLAFIKSVFEWDWQGAEEEFKRAIELNPGYALAHFWYGAQHLRCMARFDEAIRETRLALELDPLSLIINREVAHNLHYAGQYDEAISALQKTIEMDPSFPLTHLELATVYLAKSMYEEALEEIEKEKAISAGQDQRAEGFIGTIYALLGKRDKAQKILNDLRERSRQEYIPQCLVAIIYVALGENDHAFEWLDKAYEERDPYLRFLKIIPVFAGVRSDPRYIALLKRIGLEP